jgi:hypothetical protein
MSLPRDSAATAGTKLPNWTLLVYMVSDEADDGLFNEHPFPIDFVQKQEEEAIHAALKRYKGQIQIALQADRLESPGTFRSINGKPEALLDEMISTNPQTLKDFLKWGIEACPATSNYALLFWGHSRGPSGLFSDGSAAYGLSKGGGTSLDLVGLGQSLDYANEMIKRHRNDARTGTDELSSTQAAPLAMVLFKDCFQSILETAFELGCNTTQGTNGYKQRAQFMIASQGLIPIAKEPIEGAEPEILASWPYEALLGCMAAGGENKTVAERLVRILGEFYDDPNNKANHIEVPIAGLNLRETSQLVDPMKQLSDYLYQMLEDPSLSDDVRLAIGRAFRGVVDGDSMLVDLGSLVERLKELGDNRLTGIVNEVDGGIKAVVASRSNQASKFSGLSVYHYPDSPAARQNSAIGHVSITAYRNLQLNQLTKWHTVALADTPSMVARREGR